MKGLSTKGLEPEVVEEIKRLRRRVKGLQTRLWYARRARDKYKKKYLLSLRHIKRMSELKKSLPALREKKRMLQKKIAELDSKRRGWKVFEEKYQ